MLSAGDQVLKRTFLFEFNEWEHWGETLKEDIQLVESKGIRTFAPTMDSSIMATYDNHMV
jgi:hypothetical protein